MQGCGFLILILIALLWVFGAMLSGALGFLSKTALFLLGIPVALTVAWKFFEKISAGGSSPRPDPPLDPEKDAEIRELTERPVFLAVAVFAKFAKADGVVTRNEIAAVEEILAFFELSKGDRAEAIRIFTKHKTGALSYRESLERLGEIVEDQDQFKWWMCATLLRLAHVDGPPSRDALGNVQLACEIFGVHYPQLYASMQNEGHDGADTMDADYELLGCSPHDPITTIKKRYRELAKTFHPDALAGKDVHPEIMKLATEKLRKVQEAYERILARRGS
jgi:DnaJ like chaperone protein